MGTLAEKGGKNRRRALFMFVKKIPLNESEVKLFAVIVGFVPCIRSSICLPLFEVALSNAILCGTYSDLETSTSESSGF